MFVSEIITFKRNLNVLFRERLKLQKAPSMKITFCSPSPEVQFMK